MSRSLSQYLPTLQSCHAATLILATVAAIAAPAFGSGDPSAWRATRPEQPESLLVRGATLWTSGPDGRLETADLLIEKGKISAIGKALEAPEEATVIDATGQHITPGLIDAHSHSAIDGDVNEISNPVTAEVRIGDVIDSESIQIYRQLAGGVTTIHLLHGSANSIGGQDAVIKLRWGADPATLVFQDAPQGVKFALGENPKRSNFTTDTPTYPRTRQGVEQVIKERFIAARDYRRSWQQYRATTNQRSGERGRAEPAPIRVPPRRDLQLEAIVEMIEGDRLVHSHSYRHDEILMLIRLAETFGFKVASFQHVLEGYKVADEIAAHGAGASTFSDWWGFKFEVIDAIPHNGTLMWDRGVVVSFNSDSSELARRLNLEAAKAVRYGGMPEEEALQLVTLNPAIQLGIDHRVGSLEVGKDADFAIWSGHPFSTYTICEQTWVDGRKYFDRAEDLANRESLRAEREALLAKARAKAEPAEAAESSTEDIEPTTEPAAVKDPDLFCAHDDDRNHFQIRGNVR